MPRRRYLDEHDRDLYEIDLAEEAANVAEYEAWLARSASPRGEFYDSNEFCERDPFDRLKSEGGHLSE